MTGCKDKKCGEVKGIFHILGCQEFAPTMLENRLLLAIAHALDSFEGKSDQSPESILRAALSDYTTNSAFDPERKVVAKKPAKRE